MVNRILIAMNERDKGFTLIELLVVIIIIGILAAIAIPVYLNQRKKGVDAGLKSDLKNAATAVESYSTANPTYPTVTMTDLTANGFVASPGNTVTVEGGPAAGYCLYAYNEGASKSVDAANAMTYDSLAGGLEKTGGACTGGGAPPASATECDAVTVAVGAVTELEGTAGAGKFWFDVTLNAAQGCYTEEHIANTMLAFDQLQNVTGESRGFTTDGYSPDGLPTGFTAGDVSVPSTEFINVTEADARAYVVSQLEGMGLTVA